MLDQPNPRAARIRPWKQWALKLALAAVVSFLGLLALEWACRLLFPYYDPRNQIKLTRNDEGVVTGPPSTHFRQAAVKGEFVMDMTFNSLGLRDTKDLSASTASNLFVAGDSFSAGWGVEETERYSNVLEKKFGIPLFNIAVPEDIRGYARTIAYAERHGAPIRHLVLGLCMENDLWDYTQAESTHERYAKKMFHNPLQRLGRTIKARSTLWNTVAHTLQRYDSTRAFVEKIGLSRNIDQLTHKNDYTPMVMSSSREELLKIVTNYHSVVLVIPSRALWHGDQRVVEEKVHREMVQSLRDAGVKLVDVKPRFEQTGDPLQFYYKTDPHWNPRGHAAAAEALAEFFLTDPEWKALVAGNAGNTPGARPPR